MPTYLAGFSFACSATKYAIRGLMNALFLEVREERPRNEVQMTIVHPFTINTGLAQRPVTRFGNLFPILEAEEAAAIIIK